MSRDQDPQDPQDDDFITPLDLIDMGVRWLQRFFLAVVAVCAMAGISVGIFSRYFS